MKNLRLVLRDRLRDHDHAFSAECLRRKLTFKLENFIDPEPEFEA
jgi:hypothetical protein